MLASCPDGMATRTQTVSIVRHISGAFRAHSLRKRIPEQRLVPLAICRRESASLVPFPNIRCVSHHVEKPPTP